MKRIAFLIAVLLVSRLTAQQNTVHQYPSVYYQRGLELFDQKKYNAAVVQFQLFIENIQSEGYKSEAEYYLSVSKLFAEHSDGEVSVARFLEKNPGSHKTHMANLALGDYYYLKRKYSTALRYYKQVDPVGISKSDHNRFYFRYGYCQVERKKYADAMETLQPLTVKDNEYQVLATYYYGYSAYYTGDYKAALSAFRKIEDNGPKMVRLYIAQIYYMQSEYEKCISYLDKFGSGISPSLSNLVKGKSYYRLQRYELAAQHFNKTGFTRDSLDINETYEFGYANFKNGNYTYAISWFKAIAYLGDSISQYASYNLAECLMKTGNKREAMNAFAESYRTGLDPKLAENSLINQAKLAVELNEPNAASLLQKFIDNYPSSADSKDAKKLLARLMLNTDNYRDAVAVLESIGDLDDQTEESYQRVTLARGMELFKSRQWNDASAMFDKCMSRRASRSLVAQASFWKAETFVNQGEYAKAGPFYQKFIDANGMESQDYYPFAFYGMGYVKYKDEKFPEALIYFDKYTRLATKGSYNEKVYNDAQLRLGDCNYMAKKLDDAIKAYSYVSGKKGADADYALFQSGMVFGLKGEREKKISTLKRLVGDYPNSRFIPDAYFELGSEYLALKNNKEAERYFMYVIDDFKGNPLIGRSYATLGRMYYNAGQDDKAIDMYTHLYDDFPGTPEARAAADAVKKIYTENGRASEYIRWASARTNISNSEKDSVLYEAAYTMYEKVDYNGAVKGFTTYLNEMPNGMFMVNARYYRAVSYEILKDKQNAINDYKVVADANGHEFQEDAILSLLRLYGQNAPCEETVVYLDKIENITKVRETRHQAWRALLRCYEKLNRMPDGKIVAAKIGEELSAPDDLKAEALVYLGKLEFSQNNHRAALDRFAEAYSRYNNVYAAEAKYREATVYYAIDSIELCKNSCFDILDQFNSYDYWVGKSMLLLGDAFLKENDEFNAKATWDSVVENFAIPEIVSEAKEKLAKLKSRKIK